MLALYLPIISVSEGSSKTVLMLDLSAYKLVVYVIRTTVLPAKSDSDVIFCLQSY